MGSSSVTASRHPAVMANEFGNRLAGEAGFPSPKGGDIRGRYWRPATVRAWARRWAKERPWRKLSAN
jgi:hypothetical protein